MVFNQQSKLLVIDSIDDIENEQLNELMRVGFCYIKIPNNCQDDIKRLTQKALDFFHQNDSEKEKYPINNRFEGFTNHKNDLPPQNAQNLIFSLDNPLGPFVNERPLLSRVSNLLQKKIGFTLIEKILKKADLNDISKEIISDSYSAYTLVYYPKPSELKQPCEAGLKSHKDWDLVTVLLINQPGLEVLIDGVWEPVSPKPGYVVANLSNALEIMTGKRCNAALHRVQLPDSERITIGIFIGPNKDAPLMDYTTKTVKYGSYTEYQAHQTKIENNSTVILQSLLENARNALNETKKSVSEYFTNSGACILAEDGKIYVGYNKFDSNNTLIECAERVALNHMIQAGAMKIAQMVIVSNDDELRFPCETCRRAIRGAILPDTTIYGFNSKNKSYSLSPNELLSISGCEVEQC